MKNHFLILLFLLLCQSVFANYTVKIDSILTATFPKKPSFEATEGKKSWEDYHKMRGSHQVYCFDMKGLEVGELDHPTEYKAMYDKLFRPIYLKTETNPRFFLLADRIVQNGFAYAWEFDFKVLPSLKASSNTQPAYGSGKGFFFNGKTYFCLVFHISGQEENFSHDDWLQFNTEAINRAVRERTPYAGEGRKKPREKRPDQTVTAIKLILIVGLAVGIIAAFRKK